MIEDCIIALSFWHWCSTCSGHTMVHGGSRTACNIHLGVVRTVSNFLEHSAKVFRLDVPHPPWFSAYIDVMCGRGEFGVVGRHLRQSGAE